MLRGIAALQVTGRATWGTPTLHTYKVEIDREKASLHDCQDGRKTGQADMTTGKRVTHGTTGTHLIASLQKGKDGVWRTSTLKQVDDPCSPTE
jgi:hypothetical protein